MLHITCYLKNTFSEFLLHCLSMLICDHLVHDVFAYSVYSQD